jgi:hypothetical protein
MVLNTSRKEHQNSLKCFTPSKATKEQGKGQAVWPANNEEANKNKIKELN